MVRLGSCEKWFAPRVCFFLGKTFSVPGVQLWKIYRTVSPRGFSNLLENSLVNYN